MTRASDDMPTYSDARSRRRSAGWSAMALLGCCALVVAACGGDDDDGEADASTTTQASTTVAPVTLQTTTTAAQTTTTTSPPLVLVTEGATVVVANASGINGAAGRMTDALAVVGFATGAATNSSEGQLTTTKIYYALEDAAAEAVADSLREALGGGDIEVLELAVPAPTDTGEIGDASVLVAMGNDTADKTLDELQGRAPAATDDSADDSSSESSDESSSEGSADG